MRQPRPKRVDRFIQKALLGWEPYKQSRIRARFKRLIAWTKKIDDRESTYLLVMGSVALELDIDV